jgi:hypothetical protein
MPSSASPTSEKAPGRGGRSPANGISRAGLPCGAFATPTSSACVSPRPRTRSDRDRDQVPRNRTRPRPHMGHPLPRVARSVTRPVPWLGPAAFVTGSSRPTLEFVSYSRSNRSDDGTSRAHRAGALGAGSRRGRDDDRLTPCCRGARRLHPLRAEGRRLRTPARGGLRAHGTDVWVDWHDVPASSADYEAELLGAIEASHAFAFVLSPDALASVHCKLELEHAVAQGKRIRPVLCRDVPAEVVPEALRRPQWTDFSGKARFEEAVEQLVEGLSVDPEWVHMHTRVAMRANEWERALRDSSFLLRGSELQAAEVWLAGQAGKEPPPTALQTEYVLRARGCVEAPAPRPHGSRRCSRDHTRTGRRLPARAERRRRPTAQGGDATSPGSRATKTGRSRPRWRLLPTASWGATSTSLCS